MANAKQFALWCVGLRSPETQTSPTEQVALAEAACGRRTLVEIGVYHGFNTARFRRVMNEDGILFAVDPFFPGRLGFSYSEAIARWNVARRRRGRVVFVKTLGKHAPAIYRVVTNRPVEFIFIDGDHTYGGIQGDWEAWRNLIAPQGVVAFHDSQPIRNMALGIIEGSVRYVREVVMNDPRFRLRRVVDSTSFFERVD